MGERKYTEAAAAAAAAGQNQRRIEHNAQATPMYHQVVENSGYQYRASSTTHMGPEPRRTASSGITAVAASRANGKAPQRRPLTQFIVRHRTDFEASP